MKFRVRQAWGLSDYEDEQPCEGAIWETVHRWDSRTFATEAEYDRKLGGRGSWRSLGTRHESFDLSDGEAEGTGNTTGRGIRRLLEHRAWVVEVDTLDELLGLMHPEDGLKIEPADAPALPTIVIGDCEG